jgi:hypothetical protein
MADHYCRHCDEVDYECICDFLNFVHQDAADIIDDPEAYIAMLRANGTSRRS